MEKVCYRCGRSLPLSVVYYYKSKRSKDGFYSDCKECRGSKFGINQPNKVLNLPDEYKYCRTCNKTLPISNFPLCRTKSKDGYASKCKECKNKQAKESYDPEKEKERMKPSLDKRYAQHKVYYQKNRDKLAQQKREYHKTDKYKEIKRFSKEKRRTKKRLLDSNLTKSQWEKCINHFDNSCCYCGKKEKTLSMEHFIPLSNGGEWTINNIVPSCRSCNSSKGTKDFFKWYPKQKCYSEQRENKILKYLNYKNNIQQLSLL